jgi:hypothetical protein
VDVIVEDGSAGADVDSVVPVDGAVVPVDGAVVPVVVVSEVILSDMVLDLVLDVSIMVMGMDNGLMTHAHST